MKQLKLKVCGMREHTNILEVASLRPDWMGFIFFEKSPRFVGHDFNIPKGFPDEVTRVGVFVNERPEEIDRLANRHQIKLLQLHGDESAEFCEAMRAKGYQVMKAFGINDDFDFQSLEVYRHAVDYFLFDTKGKYYGGNARTFDWSILKRYHQRVPFLLSGGLNVNNIDGIGELKEMNLFGVDINSGAELSPGLKNTELVKRIKEKLQTITI